MQQVAVAATHITTVLLQRVKPAYSQQTAFNKYVNTRRNQQLYMYIMILRD